jgi:hypothetical protein
MLENFSSCNNENPPQYPSRRGGREGLYLESQEEQFLCGSAVVEEHIFNTSSEHQTVDLSNK